MADIFLSYAREDVGRARLLAEALESRRWSVWWDRRIPHGQDYTACIQQQLDDARCIVVLWSKVSVSSGFVRDEATEGLNGRLVPLLLDVVKPPLGFRQLQTANLSDWSGGTSHDDFERLVESITAIVPPVAPATPASPVIANGPVEAASPAYQPVETERFRFDAFISYAHLDNVELVEGRKGWVANFHRGLEIRLAQLLGRQPHVAMNPKLEGNDFRSDTHLDALRHAAALVSVVSPRYLRSEWASRELREFLSAAEKQGGVRVRDRLRVFKVMKTPVPFEKLPAELQSILGYEFYKVDPETGKVRELDEIFGPEAQREFWIRLDDLAHDIVTLLEELRPDLETRWTPKTGH
jgi:hypothetical protein